MTSDQQSGSALPDKRKTPKRPKQPKPPLPAEDPKLSYVLSSSASAAADIAKGMDQPPYPDSEPRWGKKRKAARSVVAWGLGLIGLGVALYFLLQYLIR